MRMWWQGMVMVLAVDILRTERAGTGAVAREVEMGAGAGATGAADLGAGVGAELTRTTRSTGAPDWTGRAGVTVGVVV
jgi:hypothetical protein